MNVLHRAVVGQERNGKVTVAVKCPICGRDSASVLPAGAWAEGAAKARAGTPVGDAFPGLPEGEARLFETGICPACWEASNQRN